MDRCRVAVVPAHRRLLIAAPLFGKRSPIAVSSLSTRKSASPCSGPLAFTEDVIPMIGFAFQYDDLADAAFAALAIVHRINAFLYQHFEDALFGRNDEGQAKRCSTTSIALSSAIGASPLKISKPDLSSANGRHLAPARPESTTVNINRHGRYVSDTLSIK
jgi:hypothetical protein